MIIEKQRLNRREVLADDARSRRISRRLAIAGELLHRSEELGMPIRKGDVIQIPITTRRSPAELSNDLLEPLAEPVHHEKSRN